MQKIYQGIEKDTRQGISPTGNIIRDAWVFGIIPESETCEGWSITRIDQIYDRVAAAWEPFGGLVSNLPEDLRERHRRIYDEAVATARAHGWTPDIEGD